MKYYIIKMLMDATYNDSMVIAEADNLIDARDMVMELSGETLENAKFGILPTIVHSSGQVEQEKKNAL